MVFRMLFHQSINLVTITEERLFTTKKITKLKMFKEKMFIALKVCNKFFDPCFDRLQEINLIKLQFNSSSFFSQEN
jgi:hypothetical protein